jgi:hypothetical protein
MGGGYVIALRDDYIVLLRRVSTYISVILYTKNHEYFMKTKKIFSLKNG